MASDEVRQCAKCKEPAVVLVFEWKHSYSGVETGQSTRDYRCQACGTKFSLYPKVTSWTFIVMGLIMAPAIFPLGFTLFGWMRLRRDGANPVVPGAPLPEMKFAGGPPRRKCLTCGNPVLLSSVTRTKTNGIPTGTEYAFGCTTCKKDFVIQSAWGHFMQVFSALVVVGIAVAFFLGADHLGWKYGGSGVAMAGAALLFGQTGVRISNRLRYPVVD